MTNRRVIVVTGASSGIGAAAARQLATDGAHLAVVGRNPERTGAVASAVGGEAFLADFDRLDEVRALGAALLERYDRIDILANNAGGMVATRQLTDDGFERTLQSNLLAPVLLTELLLPRLTATAAGEAGAAAPGSVRVLATASMANLWGSVRFDDLDFAGRSWNGGWPAYGSAKLAVILWVKALAERLTGTGVDAYSFHPGVVVTGFGADSPLVKLGNRVVPGGKWGSSPEQGAGPLIALAAEAPVWAPSGTYFNRFRANGRTSRQASDAQLARELYAEALQRVGIAQPADEDDVA